MQHLDEGTIHAWLDGALAPLDAEEAAKHAAECATCAAAVAEARGIIAGSARIVSALDDVPGGVIPERTPAPATGASIWRRLRLTPGRAALAATILLAVSTTLTLRSSSSPPSADTAVSNALGKPVPPMAVPVPRVVALDSIKTSGPSASLVSVSTPRKSGVVQPASQPQMVAERREVADAAALRDTTTRELAKTRVAQEPAAGASAAAGAPFAAAPPSIARNNFDAAKVLEQRATGARGARDSASTFEGCYRVSADSSSGSTEVLRGLPASFTLSRPSAELRPMALRVADARADSSGGGNVVVWRQLSTTQANVTFGAGSARQVSLVLTAGSPVGVASSGDRTTTVRVARASCPR